jgi:hypothetical protein
MSPSWFNPMRHPSTFKKTDVTRATRAVLAAGLEVARVEIDKDGMITVVPGKPDEASRDELNPWDRVFGDATNHRVAGEKRDGLGDAVESKRYGERHI